MKKGIPIGKKLYKQVDDILLPMVAAAGKAMGIKLENVYETTYLVVAIMRMLMQRYSLYF